MEVFDIAVIPSMSEDERNKLIRQAADTGLIIFFKQFIPFFHFRYWGTRIYIGSLVWYFLLNSFALTQSLQATMQCRYADNSCAQVNAGLRILSRLSLLASTIVFGVYSGSSSKRARQRLNIDRKTALAIIAIPNTLKSL